MIMNIKYGLCYEYILFGTHINGLVQERHNSSALAMELHLSCTDPWYIAVQRQCYFEMYEIVLIERKYLHVESALTELSSTTSYQ